MKNNYCKFSLFLFSFIFSFILFFVIQYVYCDEVWVYGFSYNISKGMIIYRDFNVLQMPLYFFIASLFLKIFGNYIIVIHIFDSLLFASIICLLSKIIGNKKSLILLPLFLCWWPSGYNLLCLFFLIFVIYLINKNVNSKYIDYLIAFFIGLCFITKQNIGAFLFVPCLFYSKSKFKSIIIFILPFLVLSLYMVYNNAFFNFINHCFLGMIEFGEKNMHFEGLFFLFWILSLVWIIYLFFRSKLKDRELFYILMFQLVAYPIFDFRHCICAFFPVMYLILKRINNNYILSLLAIFIYLLFISLLSYINYSIKFENNILYARNSGDLEILAEEVIEYVDGTELFFFADWFSYFVKLYSDIPISQYDLMLSGNVGYNGMNKKFKELDDLCSLNKCYFFTRKYCKDDVLGDQNASFRNYIIENYKKVDTLFEFDVYVSKS